ncbi:MAG: hypothetical protein MZU97_01975 [Bacillus subtilis]|nr:hypothetical protein [Bacillus subtilis]
MTQNNQAKTQDVIFEIKNRLDIVDVISEHIALKNPEEISGDCVLSIKKKLLLSL